MITVTEIIDNADGSADITLNMSLEELKCFAGAGIIQKLTEALNKPMKDWKPIDSLERGVLDANPWVVNDGLNTKSEIFGGKIIEIDVIDVFGRQYDNVLCIDWCFGKQFIGSTRYAYKWRYSK